MPSEANTSAVSLARAKVAAVQEDVCQAQADLHDANEALAETTQAPVVKKAEVQAALVQNLGVENQLQEAVKELQVVTDVLHAVEAGRPIETIESAAAGHRSGEGLATVIEHLSSPKRKSLNA